MKKDVFTKPMAVEADTDQAVTLQVAKTAVKDGEGERETSPDVCLCVGNGRKTVAVFFTVEQVIKLIEQLQFMKFGAESYARTQKQGNNKEK